MSFTPSCDACLILNKACATHTDKPNSNQSTGATQENRASSSDNREVLTDERIIKSIARTTKWAAVFSNESYAEFTARLRNPGIRLPIHFCRYVARYTSSPAQIKRILQQTVYRICGSLDSDIATALEEAAKKPIPLFDTSNRADVIWQWNGYIPLGKLVIIDGDPGLAKSMFSLRMAVSCFTGRSFLDGTKPAVTGGVVLLSAEDDPVDTIAPRFVAAGSPDGEIPVIFQPPVKGDGEPFNLDNPADRLELELVIARVNAKLVIIDPINAYLGEKLNSDNDQKVRQVLGPLSEIANRTGVTILCLRHVRKSGGDKAIHLGLGSIGYTAAARANFFVAEHPDHNGTFVFAPSKFNLGPKPKSFAYRIAETEVARITKPVPYVTDATPCDLTADDLAAAQDENGKGGKLEDAVEFLKGELEDGARPKAEIDKRADRQGIKPITLRRAKDALKVKAKQEGKKWWWELPEQMGLKAEDRSDPF